ncbi:dihydrofolate reductase family protein [Rudaeicoccus suwonensis]|uniref:RibD domain-containing protein n=1 Tax=Rudaeicoccus suwonensis TaxID=657409 RepID=A0A561E493_9MICO|nr:dihydrofolate reductase family protein [Rudaeicoccus suwonensis]TWE10437.1 RibD domain-containing protein [Rudaeicoccus suwonensis]
MRKVVAHLFSSIDGVVESPNLFQFDSFGAEEGTAMGEAMAAVTDAIMGRVIYTEWADYWPDHNEDFGLLINPMRKHVATRTLTGPLAWQNSTVIDGDLLDYVASLKHEDGGDITVCGISVIRELLVAGLLDALTLTIHPASGGTGKRLFDGIEQPVRLELIDSQITTVGNAMLTYRKRDADA